MTVRLIPPVRGHLLYTEEWRIKYSSMKSAVFPLTLNTPLGGVVLFACSLPKLWFSAQTKITPWDGKPALTALWRAWVQGSDTGDSSNPRQTKQLTIQSLQEHTILSGSSGIMFLLAVSKAQTWRFLCWKKINMCDRFFWIDMVR